MNLKIYISVLITLSSFHFSFANEIPLDELNEARNIASIAIAEKDFERALKAYDELSTQYVEDLSVANDMAVILAGMGRLEDARVILERAIINDENSGSAFLNLREILARQASISFTKALKRKSPPEILALRSSGLDLIQRTENLQKQIENNELIALDKSPNGSYLPSLGSEIPSVVIENPVKQIETIIFNWAKAWSSKDFSRYISFYSDQFKTKKFRSKNSWVKYRKPRVTKRGKIRVKVNNLRVELISDKYAEVKFTQKYKSVNLRLSTSKRMKLEKVDNVWKIIFEGT